MEQRQFLTNARIIETDDYFANFVKRGDPAFVMSRTELMQFVRCPERWLAGYKRPGGKECDFGSLVDCLTLTPKEFDEHYAVTPETYPATPAKKGDPIKMKPWTRQANYCAEWEEMVVAEGREIVKPDKLLEAKAAVNAIMGKPTLNEFIRNSATQVHLTAEFHHPESKLTIPVKMLLDLVPAVDHPRFGKFLADLKTCTDASLHSWRRSVFHENYDAQAAFYFDGYKAATGEDRTDFCHILVESYPPYQTARRYLTSEFMEIGRAKYLRALRLYCACLETGTWPDYDLIEGVRSFDGWLETAPEDWMLNAA